MRIYSSNQKKASVLSVLVFALLLGILYFIKFWPPSQLETLSDGGGGGGVAINFGDSDWGSGDNFKSEVIEVKNQVKKVAVTSIPDEAIVTQENPTDESVVIPKQVVSPKKQQKLNPKPIEAVKPKIDAATNDVLSTILKGSNKGGDGNDKNAGNKGKASGSLSQSDYYGNGGSGGGTGGGTGSGNGLGNGSGYGVGNGNGTGGGYSLGNRKALSKPAPKYICNEQGKVVVEVTVDRTGKTISALTGIKGTTNTAKCLLEQAKIAALNTRWDASPDAPEQQIGRIVYNFNLN